MPMDLSGFEYLQMLARADTGTVTETILARHVIVLAENQEKMANMFLKMLEYIDEEDGDS